MAVPWWALSPNPFTVVQWIFLTLWGTWALNKERPIGSIRNLMYNVTSVAFILGCVVGTSDLLWVIAGFVKWVPIYNDGSIQLGLCAARNIVAVIFCLMNCIWLFEEEIVRFKRSTSIGWIINVIFFILWFGLAPSLAWTDWTHALEYGYPMWVIVSSFLVSHVLGRIITAFIFYSLWRP